MEEMRSAFRVVVLDLKEGEYLEDVGVNVKIIFRWIFKKCREKRWTGLIWLRIPTDGGTCECGNESLFCHSMKYGENFDCLRNC
jgi:hypothetical protein